MNILVTGAQFNNKGAQSLLFSVMDQVKKHCKDDKIYYVPLDNINQYKEGEYQFETVYGGRLAHDYEDYPKKRWYIICKAIVRNVVRETIPLKNIKKMHQILPQIDVMIDVSGFALASKWSISANLKFLNQIDEVKRHGGTVVLMPQSFGPFDYGDQQAMMDKRITETLSKADLIFAREEGGYKLLREKYHLKNVKLSLDTVLCAGEIDPANVYTTPPKLTIPKIETKDNVGIVPNTQTVVHGNKDEVLKLYRTLIDYLVEQKKNIYIFRHSNDLPLCEDVYAMYADQPLVHIIRDEMNCMEYSVFVRQFDCIVASRYHAIVHAYKEGIPCFIFGWAEKYQSLAKHFGQEQYVCDTSSIDLKQIMDAFCAFMDNYANEAKVIKNTAIKQSCFDDCLKIVDSRR